jgi:N6-adenosine-specific RNA methylase IME4
MGYSVILADVPWEFATYSDKGKGRSAEQHYSTMTMADICNLPINEFTEKNTALFMWGVWPRIFDVDTVAKAWGNFTYRTLAWEWIKLTRQGNIRMGLGYYTRSNCEPCLLFVKGRMPVSDRSVKNVLITPYTKHSRKPEEQYDLIHKLYPEGNRLELFATKKHPGWDVWGNQVDCDINLEGYKNFSSLRNKSLK